jgi:glycosyltransferase involved in cell wall biosynthesis
MESAPRLVMLGAAPGTRSSIAAAVEAYRVQGLFRRWPVEYIATHGGADAVVDNAFTTLRALRRFSGLLAEGLAHQRRTVVHAHCDARAGFWRDLLFMRIAAAARCALIVHLHGSGFDRLYDRASGPGRSLVRSLFERAACVVAPTEAQRSWVLGVAKNARVACVPSPVPLQDPTPAEERPNMVLFLGRLDAEQGVLDLLQAVARLRSQEPEKLADLRLVCAGEGSRGEVARLAERLGIGDMVKFTGWVGPSGQRALFENAAALAAPRYAAGLPVSLLEAMAAGVPVVSSSVGGIAEAVADGASGLLVAPGDIAALARALRSLLLDRALAARIGGAARETMRLKFAPERVVPRIEELYIDAGLAASAAQEPPRPVDLRKAA